jgi:hypothetical protein
LDRIAARTVAVHARWAGLGQIQPLANGSVVEFNFPRIFCLFAVLQGDLSCFAASSRWSAEQALGRAQSFRLTPRLLSFFANESLQTNPCVWLPLQRFQPPPEWP